MIAAGISTRNIQPSNADLKVRGNQAEETACWNIGFYDIARTRRCLPAPVAKSSNSR